MKFYGHFAFCLSLFIYSLAVINFDLGQFCSRKGHVQRSNTSSTLCILCSTLYLSAYFLFYHNSENMRLTCKVKAPVISFNRAVWDTRTWIFTSAQYVQTRLKDLRLWWRQGTNDSGSIYQGKTHWLTDWLIWGISLLEFLQIYLTKNQVWCWNFHENLAWWVIIFKGKILCDVAELENKK